MSYILSILISWSHYSFFVVFGVSIYHPLGPIIAHIPPVILPSTLSNNFFLSPFLLPLIGAVTVKCCHTNTVGILLEESSIKEEGSTSIKSGVPVFKG